MSENFKGMMEVYSKMNLVMEIVRKDAEEGVVGYDEDGMKIFDLDLLDEKKQAIIPKD